MFMVVGHLPFKIILPISYLLMQPVQAVECFLKDIRFFVN